MGKTENSVLRYVLSLDEYERREFANWDLVMFIAENWMEDERPQQAVLSISQEVLPEFTQTIIKTINFALSLPDPSATDLIDLSCALGYAMGYLYEHSGDERHLDASIRSYESCIPLIDAFLNEHELAYSKPFDSDYGFMPLNHLIRHYESTGDQTSVDRYKRIAVEKGLESIYDKRIRLLDEAIEKIVRQIPGICQSDIYSHLSDYKVDEVRRTIRMSRSIRRQRRGNTYTLNLANGSRQTNRS